MCDELGLVQGYKQYLCVQSWGQCRVACRGVHCTMYTVYCTLYTYYTVYIVQFTLYSVHCTVYNIHCTYATYIVHCTTKPLYSIHPIYSRLCYCTQYDYKSLVEKLQNISVGQYIIIIMPTLFCFRMYTIQCEFYTVQVNNLIYTMHCTMYSIYCIVFSVHYEAYIIYIDIFVNR